MISFLDGRIEKKFDSLIWINVKNVGYEINMPKTDIEELETGDEVRIYTYLSVREDAMELFGFNNIEELTMFKKLIKVSGVGPKAGIQVLSFLPPYELSIAILEGNTKLISKTQGIGPKTAAKIVLELKDKIDYVTEFDNDDENDSDTQENSGKSHTLSIKNDITQALEELGFSSKDIMKAVRNVEINEDTTVDKALSEALKNI